ncbi:MAG: type II secretion system F family protein [Oligoflexia bacterium]|nr:type II secretion system F family protein [Oligoflexia bacterium]
MTLFGSPWIVIPGVGMCIFIIVYSYADRILEWLKEQSLGNREYVIKRLDIMFVEINHRQITGAMLMGSFGGGALVFILFYPNLLFGITLGCIVTFVGWKIPRFLVDAYYARRSSQFVDQLVDGLTLMSSGLKSGLSIPQAMKLIVDNMPDPISQEFELMLSQISLGVSLEEVMVDLAKRIPYADVQMFVTAVNILKDTGGNIAETFDTIVKTIRERIKIEKKIAAVTAQGVMQGMIITATPFVLLVVFYFMDPAYIAPLFNKTLGWFILVIMLTLQIIGGLMIRKIVKIKV